LLEWFLPYDWHEVYRKKQHDELRGAALTGKMKKQQVRTINTLSLVILDALMIVLAFLLAYWLRMHIDWPEELVNVYPLNSYLGLLVLQVIAVIFFLLILRQYYIARTVSRVDQFYNVVAAVTVGTLIAIALATLFFKNEDAIVNYPRAMLIYSWFLAIVFIMIGRLFHQFVRQRLGSRYLSRDRLVVVGTGDTARIIIQRVLWSPELGYDLIGVVDGSMNRTEFFGVPILGRKEDLPEIIEHYAIDEVIVAIPEKGHRESMRVMSYCEHGRVSVKVFPDIFQFVTTQASIDDLGGLPLLSVRDFGLRGYLLVFKRLIDFVGSGLALILLSPIMLLTAIAIKLESPGPVFFIQPRMSLDGKEFLLIKFRSMRTDAEKDGPGWTTNNDPRQTRIGTWLRRFEVDELPNFINVFLGEMSLVGPRPEQAYYVAHFQKVVPRYMDRHNEKAGVTGWAQVNGLRGDTSISERTKYDLWYSENWSILLDTKILLRTIWQLFQPGRKNRLADTTPTKEAGKTTTAGEQNPPQEIRQDKPIKIG
jgi:exopolysaccharide biosynthesis polyprenyl glycosylphosphotransferase